MNFSFAVWGGNFRMRNYCLLIVKAKVYFSENGKFVFTVNCRKYKSFHDVKQMLATTKVVL